MKAHLDLVGASGAAYRFRLATGLELLPAEGGNYAFAKDMEEVPLIYLGVADTLHDAHMRWEEAQAEHQAQAIYIRLNITRASREFEHNDIVKERRLLMSTNRPEP